MKFSSNLCVSPEKTRNSGKGRKCAAFYQTLLVFDPPPLNHKATNPMVRATPHRSHLPTQRILDRILASRQLNRYEHLHLASLLLANHRLTADERRQINQIFDQIQSGRISLVDEGFSPT